MLNVSFLRISPILASTLWWCTWQMSPFCVVNMNLHIFMQFVFIKILFCPIPFLCACRNPGEDTKMLVCDMCDKGYHTFCLQPAMDSIPTNGWRCKVRNISFVAGKCVLRKYYTQLRFSGCGASIWDIGPLMYSILLPANVFPLDYYYPPFVIATSCWSLLCDKAHVCHLCRILFWRPALTLPVVKKWLTLADLLKHSFLSQCHKTVCACTHVCVHLNHARPSSQCRPPSSSHASGTLVTQAAG